MHRHIRRAVRFTTLVATMAAVSACIEGHAPGGGESVLAPGAVGRDPAAIGEITGSVLDDVTWVPIPGVRVFIGDLETTTAPDGSYRLTPVFGQVVLLEATKEGYARSSVVLPLGSGTTTFRFFLKRPTG